ncbi:hypothetical protein X738_29300 [Mesorhizobium sp. LNHC209A00]|nr:hypothetical protein X738_29300 [Mesorhizobium sp. LNHC209A00]
MAEFQLFEITDHAGIWISIGVLLPNQCAALAR